MVGSIKNRIAAFENLAEQSKSSGNLLSIVPPKPGSSGTKKIASVVTAKETYGHVSYVQSKSSPRNREESCQNSRNNSNEQFAADLGTYGNYKDGINERGKDNSLEIAVNKPIESGHSIIISVGTNKRATIYGPENEAVAPDTGARHETSRDSKSGGDPGYGNVINTRNETTFEEKGVDNIHIDDALGNDFKVYSSSGEAGSSGRKDQFDIHGGKNISSLINNDEKNIGNGFTVPTPIVPVKIQVHRNDFSDEITMKSNHAKKTRGPVSVVAVKDDKTSWNDEERDDQSISPLSFQGYQVASKREAPISSTTNITMDIPVIEEDIPLDVESLPLGKKERNSIPVQKSKKNSNRIALPDIELDEDESYEMRDSASKSGSIDLISFGSNGKNDKASNEKNAGGIERHPLESGLKQSIQTDLSFSFGHTIESGLSESQDGINKGVKVALGTEHRVQDMGGLTTMQDDYDNFTLGSGESGDFFVSESNQANKSAYEAFERTLNDQIFSNRTTDMIGDHTNPDVYKHRDKRQNQREQIVDSRRPGDHMQKVDPLFLDDSTEESASNSLEASDASDENSFTNYVKNMEPVPSFDPDDEAEETNDTLEAEHEKNLNKNIDDLASSENSLSLFEEDKVNIGHNMAALAFEENLLIPDIADPKKYARNDSQNATVLEFNQSDRMKSNLYEASLNEAEPSPIVPESEDLQIHEKNNVGEHAPLDAVNRTHKVISPIYYPEEDFVEDDYEEVCFDEETTETGDLLGINFDELSMMSEGQESNFVNDQDVSTIYPAEYSVGNDKSAATRVFFPDDTAARSGKRTSDNSFSRDEFEMTEKKINNSKKKSSLRDQAPFNNAGNSEDSGQNHIPYLPLASIHENGSPAFDAGNGEEEHDSNLIGNSMHYYSSGPPLTVRNPSSLSANDEVSQMSDSTFDMEQKLHTPLSINRPDKDIIHESKLEHSSSMTYSIAEHSSGSIVQSAQTQNVPIFREKNSLRDNPKLKRKDSTISELTNPVTSFGRRPNIAVKDKQKSNDNDISTMSGKSVQTPSKPPKVNSKKDPPRRRSPSPSFGRMGRQRQDTFIEDSGGRGRRGERESRKGKRKDLKKNKSRFSWRSLSPFRRRRSRINQMDKKNSFHLDQDEVRNSVASIQMERPKLGRNHSDSSTPSLILERDEARETAIPLVAVTLSDDSSLEKKHRKKKGFSVRSLSPFHKRRSHKSSKKNGRIDPFDEGEKSL